MKIKALVAGGLIGANILLFADIFIPDYVSDNYVHADEPDVIIKTKDNETTVKIIDKDFLKNYYINEGDYFRVNDEKYYDLGKKIIIKGEFKEAGLRVTNKATGEREFYSITKDGIMELNN